MDFLKSLKNKILPPKEHFFEIIPRIFAFNYPSDERKAALRENFSKLSGEYKIWNISEYSYDPLTFDRNVVDYSKPGYPNICLKDLIILCHEITHWLDADPSNLVFVHCQQNFARTAFTLICLLYFMRVSADIAVVEQKVLDTLHAELLHNHRLYLKYFQSFFFDVKMNKHPLVLKRIALSELPFIRLNKEHAENPLFNAACNFKPYVQIFRDKAVLHNSYDK